MIALLRPRSTTSAADLQRLFLEHILPIVERHASIQFRHIRGQDRQDAVQEARAIAWLFFIQAIDRGKDPTAFPHCIATFATRRVKSGRRLVAGREGDAFSQVAQQRHGFTVHSLDDESCDPDTGWKAAATQDTRTFPVPDVVGFRVDFGEWLSTLVTRDRRLTERLAIGDRTGEAAKRFRVSPSRISHKRRELHTSWQRFQGEPVSQVCRATATT